MTENQYFTSLNDDALGFYNNHGWVHLSKGIPAETLSSIKSLWQLMVAQYTTEIGVDTQRYLNVISQWRDLWKFNRKFSELLEHELAPLAAKSFGLKGVRLLHDHFIRKEGQSSNGVIPWHQDSMYWPVDRTGMSTWLAVDDVPLDQGCLEVISHSHQWIASSPVDFMQQEENFDDHTVTKIPVRAGDIVLLHSKTWHRSEPVKNNASRLAHIALWIPEQTRYAPSKAGWHPLNEQVSVNEGELLNEDEFPVFGGRSKHSGNSEAIGHDGVPFPHGMFNARARVEAFVQDFTGKKDRLGDLLNTTSLRERIAEYLAEMSGKECSSCLRVVEDVWISASSYEQHRSRNVFIGSYKNWLELLGE